jgi:electron transport complex protein RnfE
LDFLGLCFFAFLGGSGGGSGLGFTVALFSLGAIREILGSGTLFGLPLFHEGFQPWIVMILPSGGFFTLAGWLLVFNALAQRRARAPASAVEAVR